jgi:hypothetical protein
MPIGNLASTWPEVLNQPQTLVLKWAFRQMSAIPKRVDRDGGAFEGGCLYNHAVAIFLMLAVSPVESTPNHENNSSFSIRPRGVHTHKEGW